MNRSLLIIVAIAIVFVHAQFNEMAQAPSINDGDFDSDYRKVPLKLGAQLAAAKRQSRSDASADSKMCFSIDRGVFEGGDQQLTLEYFKLCKKTRCSFIWSPKIDQSSSDFCIHGLDQEVTQFENSLHTSPDFGGDLSKSPFQLFDDDYVRLYVKVKASESKIQKWVVFELEEHTNSPGTNANAVRDDDDDDDDDGDTVVVSDEIPTWLWIVFICILGVTSIIVVLGAFIYPRHGGVLHPAVIRTR
jgi:hypothetical protein